MEKKKSKYQVHPLKQILKAYGITNVMLAAHLKRNPQYVYQVDSGCAPMTYEIEGRLRKLIERIQNPVFEDTEAISEAVT